MIMTNICSVYWIQNEIFSLIFEFFLYTKTSY
jgi:hypothetical protein